MTASGKGVNLDSNGVIVRKVMSEEKNHVHLIRDFQMVEIYKEGFHECQRQNRYGCIPGRWKSRPAQFSP